MGNLATAFLCNSKFIMSYYIYTTEALVLNSYPRGDGSRSVVLFTEKLGLVHVHGQGLRELRSKLRHATDLLSFFQASLVRGRERWRLSGASPTFFLSDTRSARSKRKVAVELTALLSRFIHGEEPNEKLFYEIKNIFIFLEKENLSPNELEALLVVGTLKILAALGYLDEGKVLFMENKTLSSIAQASISRELLKDAQSQKRESLSLIHNSFIASQL
jgi:recombinational DNA repair protein (RecF pathway)